MDNHFIEHIFSGSFLTDEDILRVFSFQYAYNIVYREWCDSIGKNVKNVRAVKDIPFMPVSFFKTHRVVCGMFEPELVFESSGTTATVNSRHYVKYESLYEKSFTTCFEYFYGNIHEYCIIGLLPNYLERSNSSLVKMTDTLIRLSGNEYSGYYLYDFEALAALLRKLESEGRKTLLLGVTFALLDFAEQYSIPLKHTIIMDTGGMKGRKKEMTRAEVHGILKDSFGVPAVHSEYGMTELLSQAYSKSEGQYRCPPWMRILVREASDPFALHAAGRGLINVIDPANLYSCSFIATDDVGVAHPDYFEVWGRRDNSDLRGCSLLTL